MSLTLVQDLDELRKHRKAIGGLFETAFGRHLNGAEWDWLFGENPNGPALVALWHEGAQLVGHTALVPFTFTDGSTRIRTYRSGTVMIDPSCGVPGLMAVLGRALQNRAAEEGAPVFGFPNANSWIGHSRFLRWTMLEGRLVDVLGSEFLAEPESFVADHHPGKFGFDMNSSEQLEWRLSRPTMRYSVRDGLVLSRYQGVEQVLYLGERGVDDIDPGTIYRVYTIGGPGLGTVEGRIYRFGHWIPPGLTGVDFSRPGLLWSDVF